MTTLKGQFGRVADALETLVTDLHPDERTQEYLDSHQGRRQPFRPNLGFFLDAVPGAAECFATKVPDEFWMREKRSAIIACPCGESPEIEMDSLGPCKCDRIFVYTGTQVRVYREQSAELGVS